MSKVEEFEQKIAEFFGAPFAVACDSCTHGLELVLRYKKAPAITCPRRTYVSVPMLAKKLGIELVWSDAVWQDFYLLWGNLYDAATLWKKDSYMEGTIMVVSMQFQKHLSVGRLGVILTDNYREAEHLKKMAYDGRERDKPWREQDIDMYGFHYYAQPELAEIALAKLPGAIAREPKTWTHLDYPDVSRMEVFK